MKETIRVWFNHWFSTAYHIIHLLKEDEKINFYVIGSSENQDSVVQLACEEWYLEPYFERDEDYVAYCLEFCKTHAIQVFVPKRRQLAIAKYIEAFRDIQVEVLVESNYKKLCLLNNKEETYKLFKEKEIGCIPPYDVVNQVSDFKKAYEKLIERYERVCFKLAQDEGAMSFRVIDNQMGGYKGLQNFPGMKITYPDAIKALSEQDRFKDLMVMPYLKGREVSIDCLRTNKGNIIVPRVKLAGRTAEISYDKRYIDLANDFYEKIGLETPCNIQLIYHEDVPYVLEVNTRMSGGIQNSCLGAGVNIPNIAVNTLLGIEKEWQVYTEPKKVSYIECPVLLP